MQIGETRRRFLGGAVLAGTAAMLPTRSGRAGPALETTTVRFAKIPGICNAPQYVAEDLLQDEGFTDVRYVGLTATGAPAAEAIARGNADFTVTYAAPLAIAIDRGMPIRVLSGVHVGCFELFGGESVRSIADLKGKSVGVQALGSSQHVFAAAMAAYVGLDPAHDIHWAINPLVKPTALYEKGQIDAFLGFPPEPQDLRARNIGHVVVNSAVDRPWSQYFCCMLAGKSRLCRQIPGCDQARVARHPQGHRPLRHRPGPRCASAWSIAGLTPRYDYAYANAASELPYDKWREYDAEDTIRFYALRLHEAGND